MDQSSREGVVPPPSASVLGSLAIVKDASRGAGFWAIAGSLTASETVYNIGVTGYPKDAAGLLLMHAFAGHSETLNASASWEWQTSAYEGLRPASFLVSVDCIDGAKP